MAASWTPPHPAGTMQWPAATLQPAAGGCSGCAIAATGSSTPPPPQAGHPHARRALPVEDPPADPTMPHEEPPTIKPSEPVAQALAQALVQAPAAQPPTLEGPTGEPLPASGGSVSGCGNGGGRGSGIGQRGASQQRGQRSQRRAQQTRDQPAACSLQPALLAATPAYHGAAADPERCPQPPAPTLPAPSSRPNLPADGLGSSSGSTSEKSFGSGSNSKGSSELQKADADGARKQAASVRPAGGGLSRPPGLPSGLGATMAATVGGGGTQGASTDGKLPEELLQLWQDASPQGAGGEWQSRGGLAGWSPPRRRRGGAQDANAAAAAAAGGVSASVARCNLAGRMESAPKEDEHKWEDAIAEMSLQKPHVRI
jgi:hypothetical protein